MTLYLLKSHFQSLLRPTANYLYQRGYTANQVTIFATLMTLTTAWIMWSTGPSSWWLLWLLILLLRMAMNAIDGMLARQYSQESTLGFVLNESCDLLSDAAVFFSFLACFAFNFQLMVVIVLLAWFTEFIAIMGLHIKNERANHGPMGKSDRAFAFSLLAAWIALGDPEPTQAVIAQLSIVILLLLTIYQRIKTLL